MGTFYGFYRIFLGGYQHVDRLVAAEVAVDPDLTEQVDEGDPDATRELVRQTILAGRREARALREEYLRDMEDA